MFREGSEFGSISSRSVESISDDDEEDEEEEEEEDEEEVMEVDLTEGDGSTTTMTKFDDVSRKCGGNKRLSIHSMKLQGVKCSRERTGKAQTATARCHHTHTHHHHRNYLLNRKIFSTVKYSLLFFSILLWASQPTPHSAAPPTSSEALPASVEAFPAPLKPSQLPLKPSW